MDDLITAPKGRLHILVMGSKGKSNGFTISRFFLALALLFGLAFAAGSIVVIYRYIEIYFDHQALETAFQRQGRELKRIKDNQAYQASVAEEYSRLLKAMNLSNAAGPGESRENAETESLSEPSADPAEIEVPAAEGDQPLPEESPPVPPAAAADPSAGAADPSAGAMAGWLAALPEVEAASYLTVDNFQLSGNRFSFTLQNEDPEDTQAQGNLLIVFEVRVNGRSELVSHPEADLSRPLAEISFDAGPGYAIRSGKSVTGRFDRPEDGEVTSVLVLAKSREGRLVLKKEVTF